MEGTRHEKIFIVIASYVIGFTTAFIAFGLSQLNESHSNKVSYTPPTVSKQVSVLSPVTLGFSEVGLYVLNSGYQQLLTAKRSSLSANALASEEVPGFYYEIMSAESSPDGKYVYYCEQLSAEAEYCDSYVYSIAEDSLYPITVTGEIYKSPVATHASYWSENGFLSVDGFVSAESENPWSLLKSEVQSY